MSYSGKRVELRPGIRIESKNQWKYNRVKNGCKVFKQNSYDINRRLIRCEDLVDYYFEQCEQNHLEPSLDELRLWFNSEVSHEDESKEHTAIPRLVSAKKTFFELYHEFIDDMKIKHIDSQCKEDAIQQES